MQSLLLEEPGRLSLRDVPEPLSRDEKLAPGQALVQVHRGGVCGTDYHAFRGRQPFFSYPRRLGHELGVEVLQIAPDVTQIAPGDRCAVEPYLNCGACIACRRGKGNCCAHLQVLGVHRDGGFCSQLVLPAAKLHASRTLEFEQLALVETLAIGAHAVARANVEADETVLIIGAGPIGFAALQFVMLRGARPVLIDINETRLAFARREFGLEKTLNAAQITPESWESTLGDLPTAVFDATGNPQSMMRAFEFVAPGGRLTFIGLFQGDVTFHDPLFHRREMTLLATRNALPDDFSIIISSMEAGHLNTTPWITHRARLEDVPAQFEHWLDPASATLKAMIEI
ncbi:MAG TPA: zinc-binding alcohol dehydrogenase family protein [Abditibacterium sp.]|jgi:2-desacetyl-2-hydroxyethyl bacteriochlorophyllide A dehydrogenase